MAFFVFSLGPWLHISGHEFSFGTRFQIQGRAWHPRTLPYSYLVNLLPPLRLSGIPVRMMPMVQLVLAILVSAGVGALLESGSTWKHCALAVCCGLWAFESYPKPLPYTEPVIPLYVEKLRDLPAGAVIDRYRRSVGCLLPNSVPKKALGWIYLESSRLRGSPRNLTVGPRSRPAMEADILRTGV